MNWSDVIGAGIGLLSLIGGVLGWFWRILRAERERMEEQSKAMVKLCEEFRVHVACETVTDNERRIQVEQRFAALNQQCQMCMGQVHATLEELKRALAALHRRVDEALEDRRKRGE